MDAGLSEVNNITDQEALAPDVVVCPRSGSAGDHVDAALLEIVPDVFTEDLVTWRNGVTGPDIDAPAAPLAETGHLHGPLVPANLAGDAHCPWTSHVFCSE